MWAELWGLGGFSQPDQWRDGLKIGSALIARRAYRLMKTLNLSPRIMVYRASRRMHFVIKPNLNVDSVNEQSLILGCGPSYLRGMFLARGYLADPERGIHLEFGLDSEAQRALLLHVLLPLHLRPKETVRRGRTVLYWKDRQQIIRLLAQMGAHQAVLEWESAQVMKTVKNRVNRLVNSETANLRRSVESGMEQARILQKKVSDPSLPPALRELALLRIAH
ncbi:MAG: DNA-binding protein WhiA, partial [Sulfobacillus thermosulfidooxidans]